MNKVLADTSAWIEFFRPGGDKNYRSILCQLIDDNEVVLCGVVLTELLRGARSEKEYQELEEYLSTLTYFETPEILWKKAGREASLLLRKGVQVPTTDLMIATVAIEYKLTLLHRDKHYDLLQKHTSLKIFEMET